MDLSISEMMAQQQALQEKHRGEWTPISPEGGASHLLWSIGEIGEVIDIIKKRGSDAIMNDPEVRAHFIEEVGDVMMYLTDVLMCYGVTADEYAHVHSEKAARNLERSFGRREENVHE